MIPIACKITNFPYRYLLEIYDVMLFYINNCREFHLARPLSLGKHYGLIVVFVYYEVIIKVQTMYYEYGYVCIDVIVAPIPISTSTMLVVSTTVSTDMTADSSSLTSTSVMSTSMTPAVSTSSTATDDSASQSDSSKTLLLLLKYKLRTPCYSQSCIYTYVQIRFFRINSSHVLQLTS